MTLAITTISRKTVVRQKISHILDMLGSDSKPKVIVGYLEEELLIHRVKFPLLEFATRSILECKPQVDRFALVDELLKADREGGYVMIGILLQSALEYEFKQAILSCANVMVEGDKWYVCDILAERVYGEALLRHYDLSIKYFATLLDHPNLWVRRSLGVAIHYATKRRIGKEKARELLEICLSQSQEKDRDIKKGFGWGLKTIAKFHPEFFKEQKVKDIVRCSNSWFQKKVQMGLSLSYKYG